MDEWSERLEQLLYAGEEIEERVSLGRNEVVVTTHRVIALVPATDGERYRTVDRPNVTGVTDGADGERGHLRTAAKVGVAAALLLAVDLAVDLRGLVGVPPADAPAGAAGALQTVTSVVAALDALLTLAWALPALVALAYAARYVAGRERALEIAVAGAPDVVVPVDEDPPVDRIADAVAPSDSGDVPDGRTETPDDASASE